MTQIDRPPGTKIFLKPPGGQLLDMRHDIFRRLIQPRKLHLVWKKFQKIFNRKRSSSNQG